MELLNRKTKGYKSSFIISCLYRIFDIIIGLVGCIAAFILLIVIKAAYLKDGDHHPVVFTQDRIGLNGKCFKMYKFRSMVPDADQKLFDLMESDENIKAEYNKNKKLENDPRITKIGKKIRNSSLDEFPQFFNVVLGDMTLVGPRPYLPREKEDMAHTYETIIKCKPAITGPWQVGGRNDIDFKERCQIDVDYVNNKSLTQDIHIFMKTVSSVIKQKGAK